MKQSVEIQTRLLLQVSTELKNQMAEIQKLREVVRSAEAEKTAKVRSVQQSSQRIGNELSL